MITAAVYRDGGPVSGAHVIAIHKLGLWWSTAVTSPDGTAQLRTPSGSYFIVAGDNLGNGAWVDGVRDGERVVLSLKPKTNRRYYVDLELRLPVANVMARIFEALRPFYNKLIEVIGGLTSRLGIKTPATELAKYVRLGEVKPVGPSTVRVYFDVSGSPVPAAVIIAAPVIAILVLILAILLVSRWAFGEELPTIARLLVYGVLVGGVAGLIVAVTGLLRELRSRATS
jgi:hypothetical protein